MKINLILVNKYFLIILGTAKSNGGCTSKGFHCENNLEEISCVTTVY